MIIDGVEMRGLALGDAAALAETFTRNRAAMAHVEPVRPAAFYTEQGQRQRIEGALADRDAGRLLPYVFVETATGAPVGAINLGSIVLGPLRSGGLGYWVDEAWHGKGLATAAVEEVCRIARDEVGLHRVEAGTLVDNLASQRVLAKAGFEPYGLAPRYLHINGAWRDHRLFQRLLHDRPPVA
ncbi:GNAT family N-acetyltransferase [Streptomyces sp. NBC_01408]|uniref:GNAT family N-acetyltransferase n=1 Tax=Streptomyces sp. NBC_01408 TaxID=2903855 RepID=UPI00225A556D|nr:GNAT family protein [Streptomyces sp. NBC_01408]MCX4693076.1 GNAT family N-acetyltransferase [Streptomyces sp. NBC_01408]